MTPYGEWLIQCIQPPYTNGWWEWAKGRAEELAATEPDCADLPALLRAERERIKAAAMSKPAKATDTTTTGSE